MKPLGKFKRRIGIEFTWVPEIMSKTWSKKKDIGQGLVEAYASIIKVELESRGINFHNCNSDPDCVEISSLPMKAWKPLAAFYEIVNSIVTFYRLRPRTKFYSSGGGQIHVGDLSVREMVAITRDISNRPYLSWIFNDPEDDINAKSFVSSLCLLTGEDAKKAKRWNKRFYQYHTYNPVDNKILRSLLWYAPDMSPNGVLGTIRAHQLFVGIHKSYAVSYREEYETLEFRFFEMQKNLGEVEDHVRFLLTYVEWVCKRLEAGDVSVPTLSHPMHLKRFTKERCIAEFKALLVQLDLPYAKYRKYVNRNLPLRFQFRTLK